jgi:hypothetical protein
MFLVITVILLTLYWIGLAASVGMDYTTEGFTFGDAVNKSRSLGVGGVLENTYSARLLWFIPFAIVIAYLYARVSSYKMQLGILLSAAILPCILIHPLVILTSISLPSYLVGSVDGETWGEAWLSLSSAGTWSLIAILFLYITVVKQQKMQNKSQ